MKKFFVTWPSLNIKVACEPIDINENVFDLFVSNLPIKAIQGHDVIGGFALRDRNVRFTKNPYDLSGEKLCKMCEADEGTVFLASPQGTSGEMLIKYGECVDDSLYIPFAKVSADDLAALKKAGKAAWVSAARTKDIIVTEIVGE